MMGSETREEYHVLTTLLAVSVSLHSLFQTFLSLGKELWASYKKANSQLIYIYIYVCVCVCVLKEFSLFSVSSCGQRESMVNFE